jgi:predicted dehydrogenase
LASLAAGKHVFCEKPLCLSEEELHRFRRLFRIPCVRAAFVDGRVQPPFRTHGRAAEVIPGADFRAAGIARIALTLDIYPPDHWVNDREQGGGRILGEVCHFVDLLMFLRRIADRGSRSQRACNSGRYSGDNVLVSLRFANGSEGTISYLANGDRAFSKERIEVFGGGSTAVLEDFRRLELMRNGRKETIHSRWRQEKGHRASGLPLCKSVQRQKRRRSGSRNWSARLWRLCAVDESVGHRKTACRGHRCLPIRATQRESGLKSSPNE